MGMLAWVMAGLAVWHFTVWLPDWSWGGIVGAFLGALVGAVVFGLLINGFSIPDQDSTTLVTALEGIPGGLLGIAVMMFIGRSAGRSSSAG